MEIMTPVHPKWFDFCERLHAMLQANPCNGQADKLNARALLSNARYDVDGSIAYFEKHGGWCDCEILMNVNQPDTAKI